MKDIKNILLIRTTNQEKIIPPLGLLYVASAIRAWSRNHPCTIRIVDFTAERLDANSFVRIVQEFAPDIVGLSSLDSEYAQFKRISLLVREAAPNSTLIAGGPLASNYYADILRNGLADFMVIGEGEVTIVELLESLKRGDGFQAVSGIAFKKDKDIVQTAPRALIQDLNEINFPAWDLIDLQRYAGFYNWNGILREKYHAPIMTSRGCVYHCIYCHNFFGKKVRMRTVENLLAEIKLLNERFGVKEFHFIDDFFNFDLERVKDICRAIIACGLKIKIAFPNAIRADRMDEEALVLLKKAGAYKINYAIETASPRLQTLIHKNLDLKKARSIIELTSRKGIIAFGFFMFGFPTETIEEMKETISYAVASRLDNARFFKVVVHKNTEIEKLTKREYSIEHFDNCEDVDYYGHLTNFSDVPTALLNNIILEAHWKFYLRPGRIFRLFVKYRNPWDVLARLFNVLSLVYLNRITADDTNTFY
ncbi:MAG: radical SAM protein [Candidatus Omnitrophica bacterium]|nr:radical SAM protein [Candidatus Omnitrophota bacterium]